MKRRGEDGVVAIVTALVATVLFVALAVVVDLGHARMVRRDAQTSADASVLAAGNAVYKADGTPDVAAAAAAAKEAALANFGVSADDWSQCVDPGRPGNFIATGGTDCISVDSTSRPSELRVAMPIRKVPTVFGSVAGVSEVSVSASAQSALDPRTKAPCGVCVLGSMSHFLQNGDTKTTGANVHFNGSTDLGSNGSVSSLGGAITVEGVASGANYTPVVTKGPRMADPLAFLPLPLTTAPATSKSNPCSQGPGIYGPVASWSSGCTLSAGTYVITGDWKLSGGAAFAGTGVTLYFTCGTPTAVRACFSAGEVGGSLTASGGAGVALQPPTVGPTKGLSIVYDRNNTSTLVFTGNAGANSGTIYAARAKLDFRGNATGAIKSLVVVGDLAFNGNYTGLSVDYTSADNVDLPPSTLRLSR